MKRTACDDNGYIFIIDRKKVLGRGKNGTTVFDGFLIDLNTGIKRTCAIKRVMKEHSTSIENEVTQEPRIWSQVSQLCQNRSNGIVPLYGFLEDDDFLYHIYTSKFNPLYKY